MKIVVIQKLLVEIEHEHGPNTIEHMSIEVYADALMAERGLTDLEHFACHLLLSGMQPKAIAVAMSNSYGVMKHRLASIYRKFDVRDYRELFARFFPVGATKHRITEALRQGAREAGMA